MALSLNCAYGQSGVGKTTLLGMVMDHFDAKAKLYTCEDYGPLQKYVKSGQLEVWQINIRDHPFHHCTQATDGFWPEDPLDVESELIPPSPEDFEKYPLRFFEGLSTWSEFMIGNYAIGGLAERAGRGDHTGPGTRPGTDEPSFIDGAVRGSKDSGTPVGGNSMSHYNLVQRQMHARVVKSQRFPCHVWWTAHEMKAQKDEYGRTHPNFGPEIVGSAATPRAPRWFGNLFHLSIVQAEKEATARKAKDKYLKDEGEHRIFLKEHYDPAIPNIPFKAKIRTAYEDIDKIPPSIPFTEKAVMKFLDTLFNLD